MIKPLKPLMLTKDPLTGEDCAAYDGGYPWSDFHKAKFELLKPHLSEDEWICFCKNVLHNPGRVVDNVHPARFINRPSEVVMEALCWPTCIGEVRWREVYCTFKENE